MKIFCGMSYAGVIPVFCSLLIMSKVGVSVLLLLSVKSGRIEWIFAYSPCWIQYWFSLSIQNPLSAGNLLLGYRFMTSMKLS